MSRNTAGADLLKDAAHVDHALANSELERLDEEIIPVIKGFILGTSQLLSRDMRGLVVLATLLSHAAQLAASIGMSRSDFDKRVAMVADKVFARRSPLVVNGK